MLQFIRTNTENQDFIDLITQLDAGLRITDGEAHWFFNQYNKLDDIQHTLVAYHGEKPVGCGAIKFFNKDTLEIKRMFVLPKTRGQGIASQILIELEKWTVELGFKKCILETGIMLKPAIALYKKHGYKNIPNYHPYVGQELSVCFEKLLN